MSLIDSCLIDSLTHKTSVLPDNSDNRVENQQTQSTYDGGSGNRPPGNIGARRVLSALRQPCSLMLVQYATLKIESLTMSPQEPRKKKSKRENGLFCLYSECTCVDVMYFVPVCTSAYHMEKHKT